MRHFGILAGLAVASISLGQAAGEAALAVDRLANAVPLPPGRATGRRSRGPQAKPRRKSNRVTIGRRTRRKHRRAA